MCVVRPGRRASDRQRHTRQPLSRRLHTEGHQRHQPRRRQALLRLSQSAYVRLGQRPREGLRYEAGQVLLISGGKSSTDDFFADASETGNDVFFTTRSQLVAQDQDQLIDLYDARVGGGFPAPSSSSPCSGDDCQGAPSGAPTFEADASALYSNASVPPAQARAKPPRAKRLTRSQLLAQALRACRRTTRNRHRRASCESVARRHYGHRAVRIQSKRRAK